jgi:rod shape-determining protein MreC
VLALLVAISLILLTDYFGESSNSGPLHSVQAGIATVLSPVQDGASKVLSPFRDVAGWFSSTFDAKSQLKTLQKKYDALLSEYSQAQARIHENQQAAAILKLDQSYNLQSYGLEAANVVGKDPVLWYQTITVDKGSASGVRQYDPVVGPGGLVGEVSEVDSGESVVTLLTAPKFAVGAMIENQSEDSGLIQPQVGNPSTVMLNNLPSNASVLTNQLVVTSGFQDSSIRQAQSWAPPGIPIGTVSTQNPQISVATNQQVQVTPIVDLQHLSVVQILTRPHNGA